MCVNLVCDLICKSKPAKTCFQSSMLCNNYAFPYHTHAVIEVFIKLSLSLSLSLREVLVSRDVKALLAPLALMVSQGTQDPLVGRGNLEILETLDHLVGRGNLEILGVMENLENPEYLDLMVS